MQRTTRTRTTAAEAEQEAAAVEIGRKITLATEGFSTTSKISEAILRDKSKLSKENALTICDYIITMKREVNPRLSYIKYTVQFLYELSKTVGIDKKFNDMMVSNEDASQRTMTRFTSGLELIT
jgi:hypothetical protein